MLSGKEKILFYHQLLSIIRANLPITGAASFANESLTSGNLTQKIKQMVLSLEQGKSLSDFMKSVPAAFSAYECNIIKAGEDNNSLAASLEWLVELFDRENERAHKAESENWYLMISLGTSIFVFLILLFLVIPTFDEMFRSMGDKLPIPTRKVINISRFFQSNPAIIAIIIPLYLFHRKFPGVMILIVSIIPVIGRAIIFQESVIFASSLGRALETGVRPTRAVAGAIEFVAHPYMKKRLRTAPTRLENGDSWTDAFKKTRILPKEFIAFVHQGEMHGQLDKAISEYSNIGTRLLKDGVGWKQTLSLLVTPLAIYLIGAFIVAMYLPIFKMAGPLE